MPEHPDFLDYVDKIEQASTWDEHTKWQHTTILGRLTLALMKLGNNSFIHAIIDALQDDSKDSVQRYLPVFANLAVLVVGVIAAFAIGRILQIFLGKEIVINQEIIIEEQVQLSDLMNAKDGAQNEEKKNRRNARTKKTKNS